MPGLVEGDCAVVSYLLFCRNDVQAIFVSFFYHCCSADNLEIICYGCRIAGNGVVVQLNDTLSISVELLEVQSRLRGEGNVYYGQFRRFYG